LKIKITVTLSDSFVLHWLISLSNVVLMCAFWMKTWYLRSVDQWIMT